MENNQRNLLDVTFIIPYYRDSKEREENLICILNYLTSNFNTNIIVEERGPSAIYAPYTKQHNYEQIHDAIFHRTKVINEGIKKAKTPYIAIYDTDVVFPVENIIKAVELLREGATLTYPYSGNFVDIQRTYIHNNIVIARESFATGSVGGACFLNREDYWKCGLENEYLKSWCPDDVTRYHVIKTLGYRIERVEGDCFHISHPPSANSGVNKFTEHNNNEYMNLINLSKEDLIAYINTWPWTKKN